MVKDEDIKNREELRKILDKIFKEDEEIKKKTDIFLENLKNGELKKLLEDIKEKLKKHRERLSKEF